MTENVQRVTHHNGDYGVATNQGNRGPIEGSSEYVAGIAEGRRRAAAAVRAGAVRFGEAALIDAGLAARLAEGVFEAPSVHAEPRSRLAEPSVGPPAPGGEFMGSADEWNELYPVGTLVHWRPAVDWDEPIIARTAGPARALEGDPPGGLVALEGRPTTHGYVLAAITPLEPGNSAGRR